MPDVPATVPRRPSPVKSQRRVSAPNLGERIEFVPIGAPPVPMFATDSPSKKPPQAAPPYVMPAVQQSAFFSAFPSARQDRGQSQSQVDPSVNNSFAGAAELDVSVKHPLMDAAPFIGRPVKKQKKDDKKEDQKEDKKQRTEEEDLSAYQLAEPHEMPPISDDGSKPPYSYSGLIALALLRAPERHMSLSQIYQWVSDTFAYYRNSDASWHNSIRHNLSLHKAFIKQERPKNVPGKGNLWSVGRGMEWQFLKDKHSRRLLCKPEFHPRDVQDSTEPAWVVTPVPPPPPPPPPQPQPARRQPPAGTPKKAELSSEATLLASDLAEQEKDGDEEEEEEEEEIDGDDDDDADYIEEDESQTAPPKSSPPQIIQSSPPLVPQLHLTDDEEAPPTPSRKDAEPSSTAVPSPRKMQRSGFVNDSGYFSSLESSVMRPNKGNDMLASDVEIDPPRLKLGRAEEVIARMRSSASPVHSNIVKDINMGDVSLPSRGEYVRMIPPPLTPVVKFQKPTRPPPSVSPNTNLRNHRQKIQHMVNSPIKRLGLADEEPPYSPAFNIQEDYIPNEHMHAFLDVFGAGSALEDLPTPIHSSPEKSPPRQRQPLNTGRIDDKALTDITSMNVNSRMNLHSFSNKAKVPGIPDSPSKQPKAGRLADVEPDQFFSHHLFDESQDDVDGVDLLQGFQKIGGASREGSCNAEQHKCRPNLGQRWNSSLL